MNDIVIPILISVSLVLLEAVGIFFAKWIIARKGVDPEFNRELGLYLESGTGPRAAADVGQAIVDIRKSVNKKRFADVVKEIFPGPELCFLSLTVMISLFLAYNYSNDGIRKALCPLLHGSNNVYPTFLLAVVAYIIMWLVLLVWREAISVGIQEKWTKGSTFAITVLGASTLTSCVYLIFCGR